MWGMLRRGAGVWGWIQCCTAVGEMDMHTPPLLDEVVVKECAVVVPCWCWSECAAAAAAEQGRAMVFLLMG